MYEQAERLGNSGFFASISVSATLIFNCIIEVLDSHQWIVGAVIGMLSLLMQWHFKRKAIRAILAGSGKMNEVME